MMNEDNLKPIIIEIQNNYRNEFKTDKKIFYHILEQISKHVIKLAKLKREMDSEVFKREVADIYLLSRGLIELEKINSKIINDSANYYLNKVKGLFA